MSINVAPISLTDFRSVVVSGTTNSTADTKSLFRNPSGIAPFMWLPLEGDVYIPLNGLGPTDIDVRSRLTSQSFRLLLFY